MARKGRKGYYIVGGKRAGKGFYSDHHHFGPSKTSPEEVKMFLFLAFLGGFVIVIISLILGAIR